MNLQELSLIELKELNEKIRGEVRRREPYEKAKVRREILRLAKVHGLDVSEMLIWFESLPRQPGMAKYRCPNNADLTWTGRGRRPMWVSAWLRRGGVLADLLV